MCHIHISATFTNNKFASGTTANIIGTKDEIQGIATYIGAVPASSPFDDRVNISYHNISE